jgi:hypothetical protein
MIYVKNSTKCDNLTGTSIGETYKISFTERIHDISSSYHYLTQYEISSSSNFYSLGTVSGRTGIKILHTGMYHIQFANAYFDVSGGDAIAWALVGSTRLGDDSAFVTTQYTGDTNESRIALCVGGITDLFEGEVVYCAVSKSSSPFIGCVDFASYLGHKFNGVMTVTYLGQTN